MALGFLGACSPFESRRVESTTGQTVGDDLFDGGLDTGLRIEPANPTVTVSLPLSGQTLPFQCRNTSTGALLEDAEFSLSSSELGTIAPNGVFTPTGRRGGQVAVRCAHNGANSETLLRVHLHAVDIDSGLFPEQLASLRNDQGTADTGFRFLYPYEDTVFPRGIPAPEIHLSSGNEPGEAFFVHIVASNFEYEGFFNQGATKTQLQMSQPAWDALTESAEGAAVEIRISKLAQGQKKGPITQHWTLAPGSLHGTIYYNTYDSLLADKTGAIMRIKGNAATPEVLLGNCTVCHGVSADGSTLAAASEIGTGGIFDLQNAGAAPVSIWQNPQRASFAALYPKNGEVFVTSAMPGSYWPPNTPGTGLGPYSSELRTKTGSIITSSGIETYYAQTPAFSPDGKLLAFTDRNPVSPFPSVLALLHFDAASRKFSDYDILASPPPGRHYSWPAFTPDSHYVAYQDGQSDDLATWKDTSPLNEGRIFIVDVKTKTRVYLAQLNGDGTLPAGVRDEAKNFMPTIAPIASGGYYWLMFTSRRTYGNKLTGPETETKRLWIAALDINAPDGADPSHPAFFLPGQELTSGNSRGFWVADPCKPDNASCASGDECCNGRCDFKGDPPAFRCGPSDGTCSDEFEVCTTNDDCCSGSTLVCINGKCAQLPPK